MVRYKFVHFVGIGGISMSGIAKVLLNRGIRVSGSDRSESSSTLELESMGAVVYIGHSADHITEQDLVVYTTACSDDNPELVAAKSKGIEVVDRATILGWIMQDYKDAVSVAGTHGKTTTTSMMTYIMMKALLDPTVMVGGNLDIIDGNFRMGNSGYFVTETCEYCRSFLKFFPRFAIILNVEEDHLDYYRDLDDIIDAFTDFAAIVPDDGYVVVPSQSENAMRCLGKVRGKVLTFGTDNADFEATNIWYTDYGYPVFDVVYNGEVVVSVELSVPGEHNVLNATACIACAYAMGIDMKYVKEGLEAFSGTKRRFEKKGFVNGALVIDDYAHHPTEIKATLDAVARVKHNRLWCIFQPHTYTRTYSLFEDFVSVLCETENVIVADIYAAREVDTGIVSALQLADKIPGAKFMKDFEDIEAFIRQNATEGDIVLTVGAGNVVDIADSLVK